MIALLGCSLEVAAAGILTARKQFTFLVGAMLLSLGAVFAYTSAHRTHSWGLTGVWWGERQFSLARKRFLGLRGCRVLQLCIAPPLGYK